LKIGCAPIARRRIRRVVFLLIVDKLAAVFLVQIVLDLCGGVKVGKHNVVVQNYASEQALYGVWVNNEQVKIL